VSQVFGQVPGHLVVLTNRAIAGAGINEVKFHGFKDKMATLGAP
jgi:hypothetical protein